MEALGISSEELSKPCNYWFRLRSLLVLSLHQVPFSPWNIPIIIVDFFWIRKVLHLHQLLVETIHTHTCKNMQRHTHTCTHRQADRQQLRTHIQQVDPSLISRHEQQKGARHVSPSLPPSLLSLLCPSLSPNCLSEKTQALSVCDAPISLIIRVEGSTTLQQQLSKCPLLPHAAIPYGGMCVSTKMFFAYWVSLWV